MAIKTISMMLQLDADDRAYWVVGSNTAYLCGDFTVKQLRAMTDFIESHIGETRGD